MLDNLADLHRHQGVYWHHYLDRLTAAVARLWGETFPLVDDVQATDQVTTMQEDR